MAILTWQIKSKRDGYKPMKPYFNPQGSFGKNMTSRAQRWEEGENMKYKRVSDGRTGYLVL